ncbi:MAG: helix-turn-helix transcriptional regulator [Chloroflexi bacterium]|nr:helix-turn-helix transcriptional regulator [Chloroflexota bacterium]
MGLSQEEVAHRAGIHVTYLSGIERGRRNPSLRNIRRIAVALGVPVRELFSFQESESRDP